jgi:polyisoprenoid-binding protein YceI
MINFNPIKTLFYFLSGIIIAGFFFSCDKKNTTDSYTVDATTSTVEWKGYLKDGSGNNGTIQVKGNVSVDEAGQVKGGEFTMPLTSLINLNLPLEELKTQLIHHLQSADFFNMAIYPEINFRITTVEKTANENTPHTATGDLTFLGKTHAVSFPVNIKRSGDSIEIAGNATFDRTLWGMTYASDENATDGMYIRPNIDVEIKVTAQKTQP